MSTWCPCTQVYFTVYNRLKGTLGKRQSLPQPMVHMLSAVGAGGRCHTSLHHIAQPPSHCTAAPALGWQGDVPTRLPQPMGHRLSAS